MGPNLVLLSKHLNTGLLAVDLQQQLALLQCLKLGQFQANSLSLTWPTGLSTGIACMCSTMQKSILHAGRPG